MRFNFPTIGFFTIGTIVVVVVVAQSLFEDEQEPTIDSFPLSSLQGNDGLMFDAFSASPGIVTPDPSADAFGSGLFLAEDQTPTIPDQCSNWNRKSRFRRSEGSCTVDSGTIDNPLGSLYDEELRKAQTVTDFDRLTCHPRNFKITPLLVCSSIDTNNNYELPTLFAWSLYLSTRSKFVEFLTLLFS